MVSLFEPSSLAGLGIGLGFGFCRCRFNPPKNAMKKGGNLAKMGFLFFLPSVAVFLDFLREFAHFRFGLDAICPITLL